MFIKTLFKNLFCSKANKYKIKNENQKLIQEVTDKFYSINKKLKIKTMTLKEAYEYLVNYEANISKKQTLDYAIARVLPIIKHYCDEMDREKLINKIDNISENNYKYVDLGLNVKQATCNVGATDPKEYGDYYAWGETSTKDTCTWNNYKFGSTLNKYNSRDSITTLEAADDTATQNWGGKWHMPTNKEWTELRTNCTWTWTTLKGIHGYEVKSKINDNSIFLPAAGFCSDDCLNDIDDNGYY